MLILTTLRKGNPTGYYQQDSAVVTEDGENRFEIKAESGLDLDLEDAVIEFQDRSAQEGATASVDKRRNKIVITFDRTLAPEQTAFWLEVERNGQMESVYNASLERCEYRGEQEHEEEQEREEEQVDARSHHYRPPPTVGGGGNV